MCLLVECESVELIVCTNKLYCRLIDRKQQQPKQRESEISSCIEGDTAQLERRLSEKALSYYLTLNNIFPGTFPPLQCLHEIHPTIGILLKCQQGPKSLRWR
mmetsp:Transcript_2768/g.6009  ORF Transcript_2768/g.6009 Transcript_2768/m.6009 type:complete len:102 (+) Transcript_2768:227-532(+)